MLVIVLSLILYYVFWSSDGRGGGHRVVLGRGSRGQCQNIPGAPLRVLKFVF